MHRTRSRRKQAKRFFREPIFLLFRWNIVQQFSDCYRRGTLVNRFRFLYDLLVLDMGSESTSNEKNALRMVQGGGMYTFLKKIFPCASFPFFYYRTNRLNNFSKSSDTWNISIYLNSLQVIGALTSVLLIWVVTGILFYLAVERVIHRDFQLDVTVMLIDHIRRWCCGKSSVSDTPEI